MDRPVFFEVNSDTAYTKSGSVTVTDADGDKVTEFPSYQEFYLWLQENCEIYVR